MANLYFKYCPMDGGKSLELLKTATSYERKGREVMLFTPSIDTRSGKGKISSRWGITRDAHAWSGYEPMKILEYATFLRPDVILVDEAQFLTREQVEQAAEVVDRLGIPVLCYGLKNDFKNDLFEGSAALLAYAERIEEIISICERCEKKATMNLRLVDGSPAIDGEQIQVGDEEYISVCRRHYKEAFTNAESKGTQEEEGETQAASSARKTEAAGGIEESSPL